MRSGENLRKRCREMPRELQLNLESQSSPNDIRKQLKMSKSTLRSSEGVAAEDSRVRLLAELGQLHALQYATRR
jgi:hypothetical protein